MAGGLYLLWREGNQLRHHFKFKLFDEYTPTNMIILLNTTRCLWIKHFFFHVFGFPSFCCFIQKQFRICIQNGEITTNLNSIYSSRATVKLACNGTVRVRKDALFSSNSTKQIKSNDIQHGDPEAVLVRDKRCSRAMLGTAQRERAQHGWALRYSESDRRSDRVERDKGQEGALHVADSSGVRRLCCLSITDPRDAPAASSLFPRHGLLLSRHRHLSHVSKFPLLF